jgi:hypothetical protein
VLEHGQVPLITSRAQEMDVIEEFERMLNSITGLFVDSQDSYALLQAKVESEAEGKDWDSPIYYGDGPQGAANHVAHTTTIAERIGRNADCGENATFVGNMVLVMIYSYWEDLYRVRLAQIRGVAKNRIKSNVMDDIRHLRNSIIHNRGVATTEVQNCKILRWFSEGDKVFLNQPMFLQMISEVHAALSELRSNNCVQAGALDVGR